MQSLDKRVICLDHVVSAQGVATGSNEVESVHNWKTPTHRKELRALLETIGYHKQYIADFSTVAKPLIDLSSKETP